MARKGFGKKMAEPDAELTNRLREFFEKGVPYDQAAKDLNMVSTDVFMHYKAFEHGFSTKGDFGVYLKLRKLYGEELPKFLDALPTLGYPIESMSSLKKSKKYDTLTARLAVRQEGCELDAVQVAEDITSHLEKCAGIIKKKLPEARFPHNIEVSCEGNGACINPSKNCIESRAFMHAYALILQREVVAQPEQPANDLGLE